MDRTALNYFAGLELAYIFLTLFDQWSIIKEGCY